MKLKGKGLAALLFLLAAVSTASVGLAAYVITGGQTKANTNTQKPTEITITNNIVDLGVTAPNGDTLLFEPTTKVETGRLTSTGIGDLKVTLTITLDATKKENFAGKKIVINATPVYTTQGGEKKDIGSYIVAPTNVTVDCQTLFTTPGTGEGETKKFTATTTLEWTWGAKFETKDPCAWANAKDESALSTKSLLEAMNAFKASVSEVTHYNITLELKDKATQ